MAHVDQPVPRACGTIHRIPVDGAAGNRDASDDLLLDQFEVCGLDQPGGDAVVGEGLELSSDIRFWSSGDTKTGPPVGLLMGA
jgi:hypothetical protein